MRSKGAKKQATKAKGQSSHSDLPRAKRLMRSKVAKQLMRSKGAKQPIRFCKGKTANEKQSGKTANEKQSGKTANEKQKGQSSQSDFPREKQSEAKIQNNQ